MRSSRSILPLAEPSRANVVANTKLYLSTLVTLRAVFPTVDVYPDWSYSNVAQAIAVAAPASRPSADSLLQRALALEQEFHFRYSLAELVGKRVTKAAAGGR